MIKPKITDLSEQFHFLAEVIRSMARTKLTQDGKGVTSLLDGPRRDRLALDCVCKQLYKFGVLEDYKIRKGEISFSVGPNKTRVDFSDFWSGSPT